MKKSIFLHRIELEQLYKALNNQILMLRSVRMQMSMCQINSYEEIKVHIPI